MKTLKRLKAEWGFAIEPRFDKCVREWLEQKLQQIKLRPILTNYDLINELLEDLE